MSGLLKISGSEIPNFENAEKVTYELVSDEVRERLQSGSFLETQEVLNRVSLYIAQGLGKSVQEFRALLRTPSAGETPLETQFLQAFATVTAKILRGLGGAFETISDQLTALPFEPDEITDREWPPLLTDFPVEMATVQVEEIVQYEFETATIAQDPESAEWVITRTTGTAWGYIELLAEPSIKTEPERIQRDLDVSQSEVYAQGETYAQSEQDRFPSQTIPLNMVELTGGTFTMGSPKDEPERITNGSEDPQHEVTLQDFAIGQTPVTQAQWRVVAGYPPVNPEVEFKENPSRFEGDDRPVEQISWYEAKEFCDRLSAATGKTYDLPTEAEWEYACRAGTTTPFYFGEMITTELANYDGNYPYNGGTKGEYREQTTPVGTFPANAWGLYDMHGNVWEWCLDHWHDSYEEKPEELRQSGNTAWLKSDESELRLLRGGSWYGDAWVCRSAYRGSSTPVLRGNYVGFRVVCRSSRTL